MPGDRQSARAERDLPGASTRDPDADVLYLGLVRRRSALLVPLEPVFGRARLRGPAVVIRRLALHLLDHVGEAATLLLVPAVRLVEPFDARISSVRVRRVPARVGPCRSSFERHDAVGGAVEHGAVMAHEQDRLRVRRDRVLEPAFALDVERVVGLVEQDRLEGRTEDHLEGEPLALTARERLDPALGALRIALSERRVGAAVEHDLGVVPARFAPLRERIRVPELGLLPGVIGEPPFGRADALGGLCDARLRVGEQEVPDRRRARVRTDELTHEAYPSVHLDRPRAGALVADDEAEQGRLPDAVRAHQGGVLTLGHAEVHALEQRPAAGQRVGDVGELDEPHRRPTVAARPIRERPSVRVPSGAARRRPRSRGRACRARSRRPPRPPGSRRTRRCAPAGSASTASRAWGSTG